MTSTLALMYGFFKNVFIHKLELKPNLNLV